VSYQSPISPGRSWYEDTAGPRPEFEPLDGDIEVDVAIVGGGYTGLSATAHLAAAGSEVALVEAHRLGDGASGRNGGQLGTGQRAWAEELETELGLTRARALFDLAEEAKAHLLEFSRVNGIDIDYMPGQLSVAHKKRYVAGYRAHAEIMANRFAYPFVSFMDAAETAERLGSRHYSEASAIPARGMFTR
jgi:gamma-glutamylputrescine oxidase